MILKNSEIVDTYGCVSPENKVMINTKCAELLGYQYEVINGAIPRVMITKSGFKYGFQFNIFENNNDKLDIAMMLIELNSKKDLVGDELLLELINEI